MAQNVYKNKNLQGEFSDPDSPYYQGDGTGTDENGQPIGNCVEINAGCTAGQEEIEDYIGDEIIIIGSSGESLYYYHPDHLGSASVITDGNGNLREHTEYFAFGETWVQEGASKKTPYMYTGKELDQETGLYYYGARYYDPRTSVWQSVDPILEKYLPSLGDRLSAQKDGMNYEPEKSLPGMGGFYSPNNLASYTYSHHNPVKYVDPDGNAVIYGNITVNKDTKISLNKLDAAFPKTDFYVTSGSRTAKQNTAAKGATNSHHLESISGTAVDFNPAPASGLLSDVVSLDEIAAKASEIGFKGIITYKSETKMSNNKFGGRMHLDLRKKEYHAEKVAKNKYEPRNFSIPRNYVE